MIVHANNPELSEHLLSFEYRRESGERVRLYLAEGDSWFSLGGFSNGNLLAAIDTRDTLIVDCAAPGDTLRNITDCGNDTFRLLLHPHYGAKWDAVLLSAGGNDVLGHVERLIYGGAGDTLEGILRGYMRIVSAVRAHQDCPIHCHTYDYVSPDVRGGWFRAGPWVGNRLRALGVAPERYQPIVDEMIDGLAQTIFSAAAKTGMIVHDTRGTLAPVKWGRWGARVIGNMAGPGEFANEIHPNRRGYARLAARWRL